MSHEISAAQPELTGWRRFVRDGENLGVTLVLFVMMLLPLAEIILRKGFGKGVHGGIELTQYLTLVVGVLGGAIAARENRLLSLSTLSSVLKGKWKEAAGIVANSFGTVVSLYLCIASVEFVRLAGADPKDVLSFAIHTRWLQWLLPVGFGLVAVRLLWHASTRWPGRLTALVLTIVLAVLAAKLPALRWPGLVTLFVAAVLGAPVFTILGGAALILFWSAGEPISSIPLTHHSLVTNPSLPTIPLFTLAGYFLAEGGASQRLVRVFNAIFGQVRGGPAIVTALVCAFFTSFTGASGVTILALGGLLMPVLIGAKYSEKNALGLLTGAGSLGLLFPPCLPLILYTIIASNQGADVSIKEMFAGGLVPGFLLVGLTAWWGIAVGPREHAKRAFSAAEAGRAMWEAKWELLMPVVALVALFGGFATPVEAAAVTAAYAFVVETFICRDLKLWRDVPRVVTECGLLIGGVLLILGVANGLTNFIIDAEVPAKMVDWAKSSIHSQWMFLLLLNLFLLVVGCLMDIYSAIVVVVPLIVRIANEFDIHPIHLGIVFLANLELGYLTPPVGMNLFLASYRFRKPLPEVVRASLPMLFVLLVGVLLITYIPALTTWLPGLIRKSP